MVGSVSQVIYKSLDPILGTWALALGRIRTALWRMRGAQIGSKSQFGARTQISHPWTLRTGARCVFESDVTIKLINDGSHLSFGDSCYVARFSQFDVLGKCEIGNHVLIATGCVIIDHNHGLDPAMRIDQQPCTLKTVRIGDDVWLGAYSIVLPGVNIGTGAVVGAHACVTKDVPPFAISVGVPAKVIGYRGGSALAGKPLERKSVCES